MSRISNIINTPAEESENAAYEISSNTNQHSQPNINVPRVFIKRRIMNAVTPRKVQEQKGYLLIPQNADFPTLQLPLKNYGSVSEGFSSLRYSNPDSHVISDMETDKSTNPQIESYENTSKLKESTELRPLTKKVFAIPSGIFDPNINRLNKNSFPRSIDAKKLNKDKDLSVEKTDNHDNKNNSDKSRSNSESTDSIMKAAEQLINQDDEKINQHFQKEFSKIVELNGQITRDLAHWPMHRLSLKKRGVVSQGSSPTASPPDIYRTRNKNLLIDMIPSKSLSHTIRRAIELEKCLHRLKTLKYSLEKDPKKIIEEQKSSNSSRPLYNKKYLGADNQQKKRNKSELDEELNCFDDREDDILRIANFHFPPKPNENYNTITGKFENKIITPERQQLFPHPPPALIPTLKNYRMPSSVVNYHPMSIHASSFSDPTGMRMTRPSTINEYQQPYYHHHLLPIPHLQNNSIGLQQNIPLPAATTANINEKVYQQINIFESTPTKLPPFAPSHSHSVSADDPSHSQQNYSQSGLVGSSNIGFTSDLIDADSDSYRSAATVNEKPYQFLTVKPSNTAAKKNAKSSNFQFPNASLSGERQIPYGGHMFSSSGLSVRSGVTSGIALEEGTGCVVENEGIDESPHRASVPDNKSGVRPIIPSNFKIRGRGKGKKKKKPEITRSNKRVDSARVGKKELRNRAGSSRQGSNHETRFDSQRSGHMVCIHCGETDTPEWRRGPYGNRTLCNACGLFYRKLTKKFSTKFGNLYMRYRQLSAPHDRRVPLIIDVPTNIVQEFDNDDTIDDKYFSILPPEHERHQ